MAIIELTKNTIKSVQEDGLLSTIQKAPRAIRILTPSIRQNTFESPQDTYKKFRKKKFWEPAYTEVQPRRELPPQLIESFYPSENPRSAKIFEAGFGTGVSLHVLYEHGFENLYGIELAPHAIEQFQSLYPNAEDSTEYEVGLFEEHLPEIDDREYDIVFSFSVLSIIHPDKRWLFDELARITSTLLILIESEKPAEVVEDNTNSWQHHNYESIFKEAGFTQKFVVSDMMGFAEENPDSELGSLFNYICEEDDFDKDKVIRVFHRK